MTNSELLALFDVITDDFNPGDAISVEDANYEMHNIWRDFLDAGCNATKISEMMSPEDIWEHYDELVSHGAKIDMTKLFFDFGGEFFDDDFTKENWDILVNRGVKPDLLVDRCYGSSDIYSIEDLEKLLSKGVDPKKLLEKIDDSLGANEACPEEQNEVLTWLHNHGLSEADIKEWIENNMNVYMEEYIVESDPSFYEKFGIDIDTAINHWIDYNGWRYFCEEKLSKLPKTISVSKLINFYSMKEIISNCSPYSLEDFIMDYLEVGEKIDDLAQKFVDEIGYSSDLSDSNAMLDLVAAGASVIDHEKFVNSVNSEHFDDFTAGMWYDCLKDAGYDEKLISKFLR